MTGILIKRGNVDTNDTGEMSCEMKTRHQSDATQDNNAKDCHQITRR